MGAYDRQIETAKRLIAAYGVQCDWRKGKVAPTDANKPWQGGTPDATVKHPFIAFIPATSGDSGFGISKFASNSDVKDFSTFGLMGVQDFVPDVTDVLTRKGQRMVIKNIDTLAPAGDPVIYILSIE